MIRRKNTTFLIALMCIGSWALGIMAYAQPPVWAARALAAYAERQAAAAAARAAAAEVAAARAAAAAAERAVAQRAAAAAAEREVARRTAAAAAAEKLAERQAVERAARLLTADNAMALRASATNWRSVTISPRQGIFNTRAAVVKAEDTAKAALSQARLGSTIPTARNTTQGSMLLGQSNFLRRAAGRLLPGKTRDEISLAAYMSEQRAATVTTRNRILQTQKRRLFKQRLEEKLRTQRQFLAKREAAQEAISERHTLTPTTGRPSYRFGSTSQAQSAQNRTIFERYKNVLRSDMSRPIVKDKNLNAILREHYKVGATQGSGSTAAAVREELVTGKPVKGKWHSKKAKEGIKALTKWLKNHQGAAPGDRAAAENVIKDMENALSGN